MLTYAFYSVGGKKYEKAQEWGLKIVNSKFIGDIVFSKLLAHQLAYIL